MPCGVIDCMSSIFTSCNFTSVIFSAAFPFAVNNVNTADQSARSYRSAPRTCPIPCGHSTDAAAFHRVDSAVRATPKRLHFWTHYTSPLHLAQPETGTPGDRKWRSGERRACVRSRADVIGVLIQIDTTTVAVVRAQNARICGQTNRRTFASKCTRHFDACSEDLPL